MKRRIAMVFLLLGAVLGFGWGASHGLAHGDRRFVKKHMAELCVRAGLGERLPEMKDPESFPWIRGYRYVAMREEVIELCRDAGMKVRGEHKGWEQ